MKRNILKSGLLSVMIFTAALMVSCQGDDGEVGPAGLNGTNGKDGTNGKNGQNGLGFDDGLGYGKVTIAFEGKRPDGVDFTHTTEFAYAYSDLRDSQLRRNDANTDNNNSVTLRRHQEGIDGTLTVEGTPYFTCEPYSTFSGLEGLYNQGFYGLNFGTIVKFPEEKLYFDLWGYNNDFVRYISETGEPYYSETDLIDPNIESFTTNPGSDGKFKFKFGGTIPYYHNSTGFDLKVTVTGDVIVFENIGGEEQGPSRVPSPSKTGKSVMKPM